MPDQRRPGLGAFDPTLYVLIDPEPCGDRPPGEIAAAAVRGGATLVQLRAKKATTREFLALASALRAALADTGVRLLINDRVDVALVTGAEGVHVGQDDLPPEEVRRLLGPRATIGLSVRNAEEAAAAPLDILDYVAIGGVFATASKNNTTPPVGIEGLTQLAALLHERRPDLPLVAIAGIDAGNAADVVRAGVQGVAVISAICGAPDPERAARELRAIVDSAKTEPKS